MMRNRLPPDATKGVPDEIVQEYNTLEWIRRALEDLGNKPKLQRMVALRTELLNLCNTSPLEVQTRDQYSQAQHNAAEDELDPEFDREPWYKRFVIPEDFINWLSNLTVLDAVSSFGFGLALVVILYLVKVFVHPN